MKNIFRMFLLSPELTVIGLAKKIKILWFVCLLSLEYVHSPALVTGGNFFSSRLYLMNLHHAFCKVTTASTWLFHLSHHYYRQM